MTLPAAVRAKLKPMLLLLSSDHDGERQAANAAIGRLLAANNCTWHDLTDALTSDDPAPPPAPPSAPEPQLRPRPGGGFEITAGDLMMIVQRVREDVHYDSWTDEFLANMEDRAIRFSMVFVSEKQAAVIVRLLERLTV